QSGQSPPVTRSSGSSCESIPIDSVNDAKSLARALQSRVAGMDIFSASAHAGSGSSVRMRGNASVSGSNEPLIVVDDIPLRSVRTSSIRQHADATRIMNPLDFVDPSDVVRVEVLRGPAATTMYGMAAANGAILIYTKHGQKAGGAQTDSKVRCPS
ncbi:TonB-dependent receptor plug domain-containing protein, partial [Gemmatimonadota bacterium]